MCYRCDNCNSVQMGTELRKTLEIRNVRYDKYLMRFDKREGKKILRFNESSNGHEIVREERLCSKCYDEQKDLTSRVEEGIKEVKFIEVRKNRKEDKKEDRRNDRREDRRDDRRDDKNLEERE